MIEERPPEFEPLVMLDDHVDPTAAAVVDPGTVILTCANCGAQMDERKCKRLPCRCGYFMSCSDYHRSGPLTA